MVVDRQDRRDEADAQEERIRELERRLAESESNLQAVIAQQIDAVITSETTIPLLLREAQAALQKSNEELERRVAKRTAELEQANAHLLRELEERKRAEQALLASEARERSRANEIETLMDATPAMIWITRDSEAREMFGNRLGYQVLELGPDSNISKAAPEPQLSSQQFHLERDGCILPARELPMQIAAATGKPARDCTFDLVFDDGRVINLIGNVNPLLDSHGKPAGAIGAFTDITELRKLQKQQLEYLTQIEIQHRLIEQREQDRLAIARNIHDGPVQNLTSMLFNVQVAKEDLTDPRMLNEMDQIVQNLKHALQELRHLIFEIRPPSVIRFGLARAIEFHAGELKEKETDLELALDLTDNGKQLSEFACLALYRIYQEAIANVLRHSEATQAWVRLNFAQDKLALEIRDNGKGFAFEGNIGRLAETGHYGLAGIKERVDVIGGKLMVVSAPGSGTTIQVEAPLSMERKNSTVSQAAD